MIKNIRIVIFALFFVLGFNGLAFAEKSLDSKKMSNIKVEAVITLRIGSKAYSKITGIAEINGEMDVAPFISQGRTMIPLRHVAKFLDGDVAYDEISRIATFNVNEKNIKFKLGTDFLIVDGKKFKMDAKPIIKKGRVFLSIRNFINALGMDNDSIVWNNEERSVTITKDYLKLYVNKKANKNQIKKVNKKANKKANKNQIKKTDKKQIKKTDEKQIKKTDKKQIKKTDEKQIKKTDEKQIKTQIETQIKSKLKVNKSK